MLKSRYSKYQTIILCLLFTIFFISTSIGYSQLTITPGSGQYTLCKGDIDTYTLENPQFGVTYNWYVDPPGVATINKTSQNQVTVWWQEGDNLTTYTLHVNGGGNFGSIALQVYDIPEPYITFSNEVNCQATIFREDGQGNQILDDDDETINVCENSEVIYTVHGWDQGIGLGILNKFDWFVTGGLIIAVDGVPEPPTSVWNGIFGLGPEQITVQWGTSGPGSIKVTETTTINYPPMCPPKSKIVDIKIIESPVADFWFDNTPIGPHECYNICKNQTVNFIDKSTASPASPIEFYIWNFGDNSTVSSLKNPTHTYTDAGIFEVTLTVVNICNCTSTIIKQICVDELEGVNIFCPSVICENHSGIYHTDAVCNPYDWNVIGGTATSLANPAYIEVEWDNVSPDGFGYISLDGSNCDNSCPAVTTVKVPVILANGTIYGPTTICSNSYYTFELPAWPATNFKWDIDNSNMAFNSSYDENSYWVEIKTFSNLGSFTLSCNYYNTIAEPSCSGRAELLIEVKAKPVIIAPEEICINSVCTCDVTTPPPPSGVIDWIVTKPDGTILPTQQSVNSNTIVLPANFFNIAGSYVIQAINQANFCDPVPHLLEVVDPPLTPTHIYGEEYVCPNFPYTYSTDVIKNSIVYWEVTDGAIHGNDIGNSVTVIWDDNTNNRTITAKREWEHLTGCISGEYQKNIYEIDVNGNISGDASVCQDKTFDYEIDMMGGVLAETYNWKLYPDYVGSISPGQFPFQCSVTFLNLATTTTVNCTLTCEVTKCGKTTPIDFPINIEPNTDITSITANPATICSGDDVDFEALFSGATPDSFIWDFDDGTTPTPTTSQVTHQFTNTGNGDLFFTVSAQVVSGCNGAVSDAVTTVVKVLPEPNAYLSPGDFVLFHPPMGTYLLQVTVNSTGIFTYQWYYDDGTSPNGDGYPINNCTAANYTVSSTLPNLTNHTPTTSQGQYWCVVTNYDTGCEKKTNIKYIYEDPNGLPLPCTPSGQYLVDYGIENFNISLTGCGQVQATCTTHGNYPPPGNIIDYKWSVDAGTTSFTYSGTETQNNSLHYTFSKAGIYKIGLDVYYENSIPNNPACTLSIFNYITVPLVAELKWGFVCKLTNDGYDLVLEDYSSVFPGFPVTQWLWTKDGTPITGCGITSSSCTTDVVAGTTPIIELIVDNGSAYPCTTSVQVNVPNLPDPDFTAITTYSGNPSNPYKSCEGREIEFTNTSTPMNNIIFHEWDFGDGTVSHMLDPIKTYNVGNSQDFYPELTVTDKHGCKNSILKTITVYKNNLGVFNPTLGNQYYLPSSELCYNDFLDPEVEPLFTGKSGNETYQWYLGTNLLSFTTPTLLGPIVESGGYWVKITNEHNCYLELNPMPALVSITYSPTSIIDGKQDICHGEDLKLKAITGYPDGSTLEYTWTCATCGMIFSDAKEITVPSSNLFLGVNSFTLEVKDLVTECSSISQPFNVTVHSNPSPPLIDMAILNCDLYEIELTGTTSAPPTPAFTWSNGTNGLTTITNHGGAFRLWITDVYGCRGYADIEVPLAPDYYFWRFPLGCYYYCEDDLQKWIDGPMYVSFEQWIWGRNGKAVNKNILDGTPYKGSGFGIPCHPLTIDVNPNGEGPGDYAWGLNNGLCYMKSGIMTWDLLDCCPAEIVVDTIYCIDNIYHFTLSVTQNSCQNPSYNLAIVDGVGISVVPSINNLTPSNLINGTTQIYGEFPAPGILDVWFKIKINCIPPCTAEVYENLILCSKSALKDIGQSENESHQSNKEAALDIVPNPASSQTNIHYRFPESKNPTIKRYLKIFDAMGRPINTIVINDIQGVYVLDLNKYMSGIYFVELNSKNQRVLTRRMVVYH